MKNIHRFHSAPVKGFCLCLILLLMFTGPLPVASATTFFIVPKAEVPLRGGKGREYKIIAVLREGTPVTLLEKDGPWSRVSLKNGKEGWILSRYLSPEKPPKILLQTAREQLKGLEKQLSEAQKRLEKTRIALETCEQDKEQCLSAKDDITNKYDLLLQDSKNIVTLKSNYEKQILDIQKLKKEIAILKNENSDLKNEQNIRWFMAGSGVLLLGWIIGYSLGKRGRRRTSSLL